jgi:hypothetical protein
VSRLADHRVDQAAARAVAAYAGARTRLDPLTRAAYAQLVAESDRLFGLVTSPDQPDPVRVRFTTCPVPYRDAAELIASVTGDRLLEVATVGVDPDRRHPLMDSTLGGEYDRCRRSCSVPSSCAGAAGHAPGVSPSGSGARLREHFGGIAGRCAMSAMGMCRVGQA